MSVSPEKDFAGCILCMWNLYNVQLSANTTPKMAPENALSSGSNQSQA